MRTRRWLVVGVAGLLRPAEQTRPEPVIFLPGVVSTAAPEFAIALAPNGREVYFNRASAARDTLTIMMVRRVGSTWSTATVAPFSGQYRDVDPFIAAGGRRLYFSSNRPRPGEAGRSFNTWYVDRQGEGWSPPQPLDGPLNTDSTEVFVSVATDGSMMFSSNRDGTSKIYWARGKGPNRRVEPVVLADVRGAGNPMISPDGQLLVLVADGPNGQGDLFFSCRRGDAWSRPTALTTLNSRYLEFAPGWDPAGRQLYFTSERPGVVGAVADSVRPPGDIYAVDRRGLGMQCRP